MICKKSAILIFAGILAITQVNAQQQTVKNVSDKDSAANSETNETSVESEYLSNTEDVIISELANSDQRDNKLVALQYLENAVNSGKVTQDMLTSLDRLAGEGVTTQSRTLGRLDNNFPDIRAKACDILAKIPTEDSKNALTKIAVADNEPMVQTAAIRALGEIGLNDNDDVVNLIAFVNHKNQAVNPTSSMALEVLNTYEKLAGTVKNKKQMLDSIAQIAADYHYVTPVRKQALELLDKLRSGKTNKSTGK